MMVAVFATMVLALLAGRYGPAGFAALALASCLALSIWLFLFEIYSPDYGFRMPWLQSTLDGAQRLPPQGGPS
jgi:hypothetical protein